MYIAKVVIRPLDQNGFSLSLFCPSIPLISSYCIDRPTMNSIHINAYKAYEHSIYRFSHYNELLILRDEENNYSANFVFFFFCIC